MFAEFALLVEGSLFLIGCLNLLPIYVSFRKRIAPQRWEFQCRILNCIIFRNEKLNLIGVVESPNCAFCQEEAESVEHLLFSCRISSNFLKHVLSWLRHYGPHVGTINESDVIFGKFDIVEDYILINHILWIGKYISTIGNVKIAYLQLEVLLLGQDVSSISSSILPGRKIYFFSIFKSGRS